MKIVRGFKFFFLHLSLLTVRKKNLYARTCGCILEKNTLFLAYTLLLFFLNHSIVFSSNIAMSKEKELVCSFIHFLQSSKKDSEKCKSIINLLQEEFLINPSEVDSIAEADDLLKIFTKASEGNQNELDAKFTAFLGILEKKGYFNGAEPGSEEYQNKVERARKKYEQRSNPFEGLTAEEVKAKGNEFLSQGKYQDAVSAYSKAIELSPGNVIYFSNRAAAYTHLKDYTNAILDSEHAIALNPSYAKAYSRLGIAYFYEKTYDKSETALQKACELDPDNATYKEDLNRVKQEKATAAEASGMGADGFPGGFPSMNQLSAMMANPQFLEMFQRMSQNPDIQSMISSMMSGRMNPADLSGAAVQEGENTRTPFGSVPTEQLQRLQQLNNPKFAAIRDDISKNGMGAMSKYLNDPEVLELMSDMSSVFANAAPNSTP